MKKLSIILLHILYKALIPNYDITVIKFPTNTSTLLVKLKSSTKTCLGINSYITGKTGPAKKAKKLI